MRRLFAVLALPLATSFLGMIGAHAASSSCEDQLTSQNEKTAIRKLNPSDALKRWALYAEDARQGKLSQERIEELQIEIAQALPLLNSDNSYAAARILISPWTPPLASGARPKPLSSIQTNARVIAMTAFRTNRDVRYSRNIFEQGILADPRVSYADKVNAARIFMNEVTQFWPRQIEGAKDGKVADYLQAEAVEVIRQIARHLENRVFINELIAFAQRNLGTTIRQPIPHSGETGPVAINHLANAIAIIDAIPR